MFYYSTELKLYNLILDELITLLCHPKFDDFFNTILNMLVSNQSDSIHFL